MSACTSAKNRNLESQSIERQKEIGDEQKLADSLAEKRFNDKFEKIRQTFNGKAQNRRVDAVITL